MTRRTYLVTVGPETVRVTIRRDADGLFAQVGDGEELAVDLTTVRNTLRCVALNEKRVELLAERYEGDVLVALNGLQYRAEVVDEARARLARVGARQPERLELAAPMPGLVVRVLCEPGEKVEAGQPLVVLQAMKMENELSLSHPGTIQSISVGAGQTVDQGQVLVVLE